MKSLTDLRSIGAAAFFLAAGPVGAVPACDAVKAALAGDHKTFGKKMQETYPQLKLDSCAFKDKARFICLSEFDAADAVEMFGDSALVVIAATAAERFRPCGATYDRTDRYKDGIVLHLKVPSGKRIASVKFDAYLWEGDRDDLNLDIEIK